MEKPMSALGVDLAKQVSHPTGVSPLEPESFIVRISR